MYNHETYNVLGNCTRLENELSFCGNICTEQNVFICGFIANVVEGVIEIEIESEYAVYKSVIEKCIEEVVVKIFE